MIISENENGIIWENPTIVVLITGIDTDSRIYLDNLRNLSRTRSTISDSSDNYF